MGLHRQCTGRNGKDFLIDAALAVEIEGVCFPEGQRAMGLSSFLTAQICQPRRYASNTNRCY